MPSNKAKLALIFAYGVASQDSWSEWSQCSEECGIGIRTREKPQNCDDINNLPPGQECSFDLLTEEENCVIADCPGWSEWSDWSKCSAKSCTDPGRQYRDRKCTGDDLSLCEGPDMEVKECQLSNCQMDCESLSDDLTNCLDYAKMGYCTVTGNFDVYSHCKNTCCRADAGQFCNDKDVKCQRRKHYCENPDYKDFMEIYCPVTCKKCPIISLKSRMLSSRTQGSDFGEVVRQNRAGVMDLMIPSDW